MNKPFVIILSIYVLFSLVSLNGKAQDLTTGLISVWELDETSGTVVNDALSLHNGTNVGPAVVNITGNLNKCYDFDGTNDIVDFNTKLISGFPFSLSIWFKAETLGKYIFSSNTSVPNYDGVVIYADGTRINVGFGNGSGVGTSYRKSYDYSRTMTTGVWYHLVVTATSISVNDVNVYINGVQLTGGNASGTATSADWSLGESQMASNYGGVTTNRWDGLLDQFALWSRVINTSEIAALYNTGNGLAYINWGGTQLSGGTISPSSLTIVSGQSPGTISSTSAASGGAGSYIYQWQNSTNGSSYTDISGASTTSYTAPSLTQNTWYRRKVTDGAATVAYSNVSAITVTAGTGEEGAPADVNYLVGTANGTLSNEIVVGTTPGGILGGTWASPTIDNNSIGFSHISAYGTPTTGSFLGYSSTYGLAWSPVITGTGASARMPYFTGTYSISSETEFTYNTTNNTLDVDNVTVNSNTYGSGWDGSLKVPTQNDVYDKIESLTSQSGTSLWDPYTGYISYSGSVCVGTATSPLGGDYKLMVNGKVRAKEVVVETSWADYVFDDKYPLRSLNEIEAFIKTNKHLPEIPSAKEVEANGVDLGEMNMLLLKKIEELTLYLINQQKEIERLKKTDGIISK